MQQHDNGPNQLPNLPEEAEFLAWAFQVFVGGLGAMIIPFTRRSIGHKYLSFRGFVGLIIFWFYSIAVSPGDTSLYAIGTFVWIFMAFWSTAPPDSELFGNPVHSCYSGWPRIADWFRVKESTAKGLWEVVLGLSVGWLVATVADKGLGIFIMFAAVGAFVDFGIIDEREKRRVREMRDAEIESQYLWDLYEQRYGR